MAANFSFMSMWVALLVQTEWRTVMLSPEALEYERKLETHTHTTPGVTQHRVPS